jgi:two-component system, LytTR family, response regulator
VKMRVLLVDDEPLARRKLRRLLNGECDVEIVGESADGAQAVAAIEVQKPDLVFLDVQMPEMDGLGVVHAIGPQRMPLVVFVTAHDRYAVKAFEVSALDYLLKPVNRERFQAAVARARSQMDLGHPGEVEQRLHALLEHLKSGQEYSRRLMLKSEGRVYFLTIDEIDWIEAAHNYLVLHVGKKSHLIRETLDSLEARLDPDHFVRIHRSTMVNLDRIQEMHPWVRGEHAVFLRDGTRLTLSRSYYERLRQRLGEPS